MKNLKTNAANSAIATPEQSLDLDFDHVSSSEASAPDKTNLAGVPAVAGPQLAHPATLPQSVLLLDPALICVGAMPNRTLEAYSEESFDELCDLISAAGCNTVPISVRPISDAIRKIFPHHHYELISGERRLRACIECDQWVRAIVIDRPLSSRSFEFDAIIENLSREGLTAYEFGRQILHITRTAGSMSLGKLARHLGRDKSLLSRARELAELPTEIISAFASTRDLRYADAKTLTDAVTLAKDAVLAAATRIYEEGAKLKPSEVVKRLVDAAKQVDVVSSTGNGGLESGGVASCNTPVPKALTCADRNVGELTLDRKGQVLVTLSVALDDAQQSALARQIEAYIRRRVLRLPAEKPQAKPDGEAKAGNADDTAAQTQALASVEGGVA